jgi:hypothetical protein
MCRLDRRWNAISMRIATNARVYKETFVYYIAAVISDEYKSVCSKSIKTKADYEAVVEVAQDREQWK